MHFWIALSNPRQLWQRPEPLSQTKFMSIDLRITWKCMKMLHASCEKRISLKCFPDTCVKSTYSTYYIRCIQQMRGKLQENELHCAGCKNFSTLCCIVPIKILYVMKSGKWKVVAALHARVVNRDFERERERERVVSLTFCGFCEDLLIKKFAEKHMMLTAAWDS